MPKIKDSASPDISYSESRDHKAATYQRITQIITDFVFIALIGLIWLIVYLKVEPKTSYFYCDETDIFYPYLEDTIPFWAVGIYGILGPLIIILLVELTNILSQNRQRINGRGSVKTFFIHFFHAFSLFLMGAVITALLTEIGKRWIGRLRPHFMDLCKPDFSKINCTINTINGEVYNAISTGGDFCTGDEHKIKEARYSFPSGHSSFSWYTMIFTIIYLEARFVRLRLRYVKVIIQMTCFITAFVTMLSRVSDYHHRGSDVIAGTILGTLVALFITLVTGRVLFEYNRVKDYKEIDLKPIN